MEEHKTRAGSRFLFKVLLFPIIQSTKLIAIGILNTKNYKTQLRLYKYKKIFISQLKLYASLILELLHWHLKMKTIH